MRKNAKSNKMAKEGPFIESARAKKIPGKTVKVGGTKIISKAGKKPIAMKVGGLHETLGISQAKKIPAKIMKAALEGKKGKLAKKQALFKKNVLTGAKKRK